MVVVVDAAVAADVAAVVVAADNSNYRAENNKS